MSIEPGQIIDAKYRVVRLIGEGGMGTVYEGENSRIGRRVAIKVLHAQVASMPEFVERFEREARAAARIGSPHVCDVLDLGDLPNGDRYIVMEYLDGVSFEDRIAERGKHTCAQIAPIAFELLEGLGTMHNARVIHRDLKPANVFLARTSGGRGEVVKILDFGVAKLLPTAGEIGTMTRTGMMMGTPLYMSPEQARGARDVDGRTDIYAASVMFYRALAGVLPYHAESLNELLFKIVLEDPKPLREIAPEVDEAFAAIVHKGLARDVNARYATAREYQEAIATWGRAQGRSSLSFAVTVPSEPPPVGLDSASAFSAASASAAAPAPVVQTGPVHAVAQAGATYGAPGVAGVSASSGGTPIAWSEDAPSVPASRGAATVLTPMASSGSSAASSHAAPDAGAAHATSPVAGASSGAASVGSARAAGVSPDTLASPSASPQSGARKSIAEEGAVALAKSGASPATVSPAIISPAATSGGSATLKRSLLLGGLAVGAAAVVAIVAFSRGGGTPATPTGLSPATAGSSSSAAEATTAPTASAAAAASGVAAASNQGGESAPPEPASGPSPTSVGAAAAALNGERPGGRRAPGMTAPPSATSTSARRGDGTAAGTSAGTAATVATSVTAATAGSAAAPPATSVAKPAASARKFRTNLD